MFLFLIALAEEIGLPVIFGIAGAVSAGAELVNDRMTPTAVIPLPGDITVVGKAIRPEDLNDPQYAEAKKFLKQHPEILADSPETAKAVMA
jgi:hypothetical protein